MAGACLPLLFWVFSALGRNVTPTANARENATLVTHGPYRYVRHSFSTVATAYWVGLALLSWLWVIPVALVLGGRVLVRRTREEERHLIDRFDDR